MTSKNLVEDSHGARVIFLEGFNIPLIVVKSDGGYNYASTDLTAIWLVVFTTIILVLINFEVDDALVVSFMII